ALEMQCSVLGRRRRMMKKRILMNMAIVTFVGGYGVAHAEAPIVFTQAPKSAGKLAGVMGSVKVSKDWVHVTMAVPTANLGKSEVTPYLWVPGSHQATVDGHGWIGITLGKGKVVGEQTVFKGRFKNGEFFNSNDARLTGAAFGALLGDPGKSKGQLSALW